MASRSPSPSRSAKLGVLKFPTSTPLKGIGHAGLLHEDRRNCCPGILEIVLRSVVFADHGVEVTVPVKIRKARRAVGPNSDAVEGIGSAGDGHEVRRDGSRRGVFDIIQIAEVLAHDGVEVAVPVEVPEARRAVEPKIDAVERIARAGALHEGRSGGRAGVLEIVQDAAALTGNEVEIAVA